MTQQIHSFRASGVRSFQAARIVASESRALRKSTGVLWTGPGLLSLFIVILHRWNLQSKQPFNPDVLGQLEQCVEPLVLAQRFAVDFDSEC